jgi:hypothetical protein
VNAGARATLAELDDWRSRYSHVIVETPDRQAGFALFGGWKARHLFQRLYLGVSDHLRGRPVFHRAATAAYCRSLARRHGLVVFCGNSAPPGLTAEVLSIPVLVDMEMATPRVFEGPGRWGQSVMNDLRKIRQGRFAYDIVPGSDWVPEFYARMMRPTIIGRHGAEAYVASRHEVAQHAAKPRAELLRVLVDGKWVGASLNETTAAGYKLHKLGWVHGDAALLKQGVVAALYWFNLHRAAELGCPRVFFGPVTPCVEDGLLRYKSKWGAQLSVDGGSYGHFQLLLDPAHPVCRRFLETHSLITRGTNREFIVFSGGHPNPTDTTHEVLSSISRWYMWRQQPSAEPQRVADEVPPLLRPWLDATSLRRD